MYFAVRHKPHRIDDKLRAKITAAIPNRIAYFDGLNLKMHPVIPVGELARLAGAQVQKDLKLTDDQKAKIKALRGALTGEIKKLEKQKAKIAELERQFDAKAVEVLTVGQRKALKVARRAK